MLMLKAIQFISEECQIEAMFYPETDRRTILK